MARLARISELIIEFSFPGKAQQIADQPGDARVFGCDKCFQSFGLFSSPRCAGDTADGCKAAGEGNVYRVL